MQSGIVPFNEILESIKDATGIRNLSPYIDKIRRFIFKVEEDIGSGGMMIRKQKKYVLGTDYDGKFLQLPDDFIREYYLGSLTYQEIKGRILYLKSCFQNKQNIILNYIGFILDNDGNPFTTRNRLEAHVLYFKYRTYNANLFLNKKGSNRQLAYIYKQEYEDEKLNARGKDVMPSEEEYKEIGRILHLSTIELIQSDNCPIVIDCKTEEEITTTISAPGIYSWQYDDLLTDITDAENITQEILNTKDFNDAIDFADGKMMNYTNIGRIGFAIQQSENNQYKIYDILNNDITNIFDKYYNEDMKTDFFVSKEYIVHSSVYIKIENTLN